jgi:hypothetical protein
MCYTCYHTTFDDFLCLISKFSRRNGCMKTGLFILYLFNDNLQWYTGATYSPSLLLVSPLDALYGGFDELLSALVDGFLGLIEWGHIIASVSSGLEHRASSSQDHDGWSVDSWRDLDVKEQRDEDRWGCLVSPSAKNILKLGDVKLITLTKHWYGTSLQRIHST